VKRREFLAAAMIAAPLALSPAAKSVASGGTPTVLVTADRESHVVAIELPTGRVVRRVRTLPAPRSIEAAFAMWAVVAHTASGRLSVLDGRTLKLRSVISGFREPRYTAVHPVRHPSESEPAGRPLAYVTDSLRREVVTVDLGRGTIVLRTAVPGPARHITVSPDGGLAWTALGSKADRVAVLDLDDPRRPRLARTLVPPFLAHDLVCSDDGDHLWVTSGDARRIAIYEPEGRRPVAVLDAGAPPQHVAFRGRRAFVASGNDGTVSLHRPDGVVLEEARVPVGSYNVTSSSSGFGRLGAVTPSLGLGTIALLGERGQVTKVRRVARAAHDACLVVRA
jgi:hypothetical protein